MRPVCCRSSSELRINVRTMLKDAATLSWLGLVKQALPSKGSCWLASANGAVVSSSPGEGRTAIQTIVLPSIRSSSNSSSSSSSSSSGAARGSPCSRAARAAHSKKEQQLGSPLQQMQQQQSSSSNK